MLGHVSLMYAMYKHVRHMWADVSAMYKYEVYKYAMYKQSDLCVLSTNRCVHDAVYNVG